jgi:hypothetical protein
MCLFLFKCMLYYISVYFVVVALPNLLVAGDVTNWYRSYVKRLSSGIARPVGGWGCYKLVSELSKSSE